MRPEISLPRWVDDAGRVPTPGAAGLDRSDRTGPTVGGGPLQNPLRIAPDARERPATIANPSGSGPPGISATVPADVLSHWLGTLAAVGDPSVPSSDESDGMTSSQMRAIRCLPDDGMSMGLFARTMVVSYASDAALADRLIQSGAANRVRNVEDRRSVVLRPTSAGVARSDEYWSGREAVVADVLFRVPAEWWSALIQTVDLVLGILAEKPHQPPGKVLTPDPKRWGER